MKYERDEPAASHISDPAACAAQTQGAGDMAGTGADALSAAEATKLNAHLDAIRVDTAALKTAIDANNAAIDSILVALENAGIAKSA